MTITATPTLLETSLMLPGFMEGPRVRFTDPVTSHQAADSTEAGISLSQAFVHDLLRIMGPSADHELQAAAADTFTMFPDLHRWSPSRIRTARHELVEAGLVRQTPIIRLTVSGRRAIVWAVIV